MKTKRFISLTALIITAMLVLGFAGCDLAGTELGSEDLTVSRSADSRAPAGNTPAARKGSPRTAFTATVMVAQVPGTAQTNPVSPNNPVRYRTTDEVIAGYVAASDWDLLTGTQVVMDNFTNFSMVPAYTVPTPDGPLQTFDISGTNHTTVTIYTSAGEIRLKANGKIEGNIPFGADLDLNVSSIANGGSAPNIQGTLDGTFYWNPTAQGALTLTGYYK